MIRPRALGHRGTVIATGFAIDTALVGVAEARRRVLALWTPGATVRAHGAVLLITGLPPARVHAARSPGAPLVAHGGVIAALPLDRAEQDALVARAGHAGHAGHAGSGTVVLASGGVAELIGLGALPAVDIAAWIGLADYELAEVDPLAAPAVRAAIPAPPHADARALAGLPAEHRDAAAVAAGLAAARRGESPAGPLSWPRRLAHWLAERLAPRRRALPPPGAPGDAKPAPRPSLLDRLRGRLAEALWRSRLGAVLGRRHAAYLQRVLDLFDRGELDDALRLAIPLGDEAGGDSRLALAVPRPRRDLRLSMTVSPAGSAIPVADTAIESMRARYRAAAARLEHQDRIEEAAFVLADLLGDVMAAIALLERHRRFALAAQLAEGRGLPPAVVVRLWVLAGDRRRAIDVARRHRAWAPAVALLERTGDRLAAVLRMIWADHLADAGDFVQAVEVAWPVASSRRLIRAWIDRGIAAEGAVAARMLVKKLVIAPDELAAVAPATLAILDDRDPDPEAGRRRRALIEELVAAPASRELRTIARPAVRALLRDCGAVTERGDAVLLDRLVRFADDAALRADLPALSPAPAADAADPGVWRGAPLALRWPAHDAGALAVHDAAPLPGGRILVALGELGVRLLGRDGRTLASIDQPAARLVVSDHGTRALAIAPRGQVRRLARLDLIERRGAHWCDAECDGGPDSFDGDLWIATRGREVLAVDTTAARWRAVWGIETEPATARCRIRRDAPHFVVEAFAPEAVELWYFEGFTLRRRNQVSPPGAPLVAASAGRQDWLSVHGDAMRGSDWTIALDDAPPIALELAGDLAAVAQRHLDGVTVTAVDLNHHRAIAVLAFDGATTARLRLVAALLTVADDRGRIAVIDLRARALVRDLRASA